MKFENSEKPEVLLPKVADKENAKTIEWVEIISLMWSSRGLIGQVVGIVAVLSITVSLLLPKYYRSTAILLPENTQAGIASLVGLSGLASLAGVSFGRSTLEELYPDIVLSEAVLKEVIYEKYQSVEYGKSVDLIEYWDISESTPLQNFEAAIEKLRDELEITFERRKNVMTISLLMKEPQLASDVLSKLVNELDSFIRKKRKTNASEQRKWIESRLEEVSRDLSRSEESLKVFREKNRRIIDSPELILVQERLRREIEINTAIYTELKKQYELAKIEEIKNIPVINLMDPPRPAALKEKPKRRLIVAISILLGFAGAGAFVLGKKFYAERFKTVLRLILSRQ